LLRASHKYCDPLITSVNVYIDSIESKFSIDSFTAGELGKFNFYDSSIGNRVTVGGELVSKEDIEWYFNVPQDQDASTWMTANSSKAEKLRKADAYHDYEQYLTPLDAKEVNDKKEYTFKVCLRVYSKRPCPDDTCQLVTFRRDFETFNIFTPGNNDGKNDVFDPRIKGEKYYNIMIFNRWGNKVFESDDAEKDWNGKNQNDGSDCPAGTYFYIVKYDLIGKQKGVGKKTGTVTIVR
jgi:gliding motility-associated-like protein